MQNLFIIFIFGLMIGSFLNVCIYRIPSGESIWFPRSHCTSCGHTLGTLELIPVISYLGLGRKCKSCNAPISPRYMCIELLTGICFGVGYSCYGLTIQTLIGCTFAAFSIVLTMIDWDQMILPTSIIRCGMIMILLERIIEALQAGNNNLLWNALLGGVIGYILFIIIFYGSLWILKKEGIGYGDVRLMGFVGLCTGANTLFIAVLLASLLASVYGIVLLKVKKKSEPYPFGPFLNIGGWIAFLFGNQILTAYLSLFNL